MGDRGGRRDGGPAPEGEFGAPRPAATPGAGHLLFVPFSDRYVLVEREGDAPPRGEEVALPDVNERRFRVSRLGRSPSRATAAAAPTSKLWTEERGRARRRAAS